MCKCPQFRGRKTKLIVPSTQELMEFGETIPRALNTVSPHIIALRQHQQSQVLGAALTQCQRWSRLAKLKRLERQRQISCFSVIGGHCGLKRLNYYI